MLIKVDSRANWCKRAMDDVVRVNSDTGELIVQVPDVDNFNATLNISLACASELARGVRDWDQLSQCIRYTMDVFSLTNLRIYLFPFRIWLPWETAEEADVSVPSAAVAAAAAGPGGSGSGGGALAPHVDHDHGHGHDHYDPYYFTGFEIVYLLIFLSLLVLLCGAAIGDVYVREQVDGPDGTEWRYRDGRYVRVAATPATPASEPRDVDA